MPDPPKGIRPSVALDSNKTIKSKQVYDLHRDLLGKKKVDHKLSFSPKSVLLPSPGGM